MIRDAISPMPPATGRRAGGLIALVTAVAGLCAVVLPVGAAPQAPASTIGDLVAVTNRATPPTPPPSGEGARAETLSLTGWSVGGDESHTVVTFEVSRAAPIRVFALAAPTRVVIDMPAGRFERAMESGHAARGLISAWRAGAFAAGRSRLVLETRGPVRVARAEFDGAAPAGKHRLVVELAAAQRDEMLAAAPIDIAMATPPPPDAPAPAVPSDGAAAKGDRGPLAPVVGPAPPLPAPTSRPVVVIDAGHGGNDAGTVSPATGTPEKTVVLAMARVLAERLAATGRYEVVSTRREDVFLGLGERVRIARSHRADLLLSIHADAEYDHSVRGATVYTLAETASDEKAAALAAKENQSDALAGHAVDEAQEEVAGILADLTRRETRRLSHLFARDILAEYRRYGRLVKTQPHRQAGLRVLRAHDVPAALVELGFLSNKEDEALMTSPDWREKTATSLITAIDRYFAGRDALAEPTKDGEGRAPASP